MLGALLATLWGRPAEAERRADAAELASYDGGLPDGSASIDSWLALLRAHRCQRGVARMRADAELALELSPPGSRGRPHALLLLAVSRLLAGEVDEADDLFADVVEAGLELGTAEEVAVALGERAAIAIGRDAWVQAEELADQALREHPPLADGGVPDQRARLRGGRARRAAPRRSPARRRAPRQGAAAAAAAHLRDAVDRRSRRAWSSPAPTSRMADAGGAETMLREIDGLLRRQPDLGTLPAEVQELRSSLQTMRAHAPGASTLTEAELRVLPYLATHLSFREIGERLFLSRHTVKSHAMAIYRKLNVTSRNDAVERAGALGLL